MPPQNPRIYHITDIDNLPTIIERNGLCCDTERGRQGVDCVGIAYQHIKDRRANKHVPVAAGGMLADYVPFYFCNRSPMLFTINKGNVEGYKEGQVNIVHLVSSVDTAVRSGRPWCFTDGHAVMAMSAFYCDTSDLGTIDWDIIDSYEWYDCPSSPDRKRRKQAEFLVHERFDWEWVESIGVMNQDIQQRVQAAIQNAKHQPPVHVRRQWYY